jgi:hypothetical protein
MTSELKLDEGSDAVVVQGGIKVTFNTVGITVNVQGATVTVDKNGTVAIHAAANDAGSAKAEPQIPLRPTGSGQVGDIERDGVHKGEIYGGIYPADNKPIWFSAAPKLMDHYKAAAWAEEQGGSLPTREHGDYLTALRISGGAFTEIFNRGGSYPAGYVWLAEPDTIYSYGAWCQTLSDGGQFLTHRGNELSVLCVRR